VFLLKNMGYIATDAWTIVWPVLLIVVGLGLLFRRGCWCFRRGHGQHHCCGTEEKNKIE